MSGTNRVINSIITKKGGSESVLTKALEDANTKAIKIEDKKEDKTGE